MQYHLWVYSVSSKGTRIFGVPWHTNIISTWPGYSYNWSQTHTDTKLMRSNERGSPSWSTWEKTVRKARGKDWDTRHPINSRFLGRGWWDVLSWCCLWWHWPPLKRSSTNRPTEVGSAGCSLSLPCFIPAFTQTVPLLHPTNLLSLPAQAEAQRIRHEKWRKDA